MMFDEESSQVTGEAKFASLARKVRECATSGMDRPAPQIAEEDQAWSRLMNRAQDGDSAAYRRLLTELAPYLRLMAARHHRDRRDVEDTVQDILLTVHSIRHTYDPERPFKPWLAAIARRRIIDRLRVQGRMRARETELSAEHETFPTDGPNIHEAESESRVLRAALDALPEGQRTAVRLLKIEEKSLREAAAATGMSVVSLKVSTHRALKNLRKILERKSEMP